MTVSISYVCIEFLFNITLRGRDEMSLLYMANARIAIFYHVLNGGGNLHQIRAAMCALIPSIQSLCAGMGHVCIGCYLLSR